MIPVCENKCKYFLEDWCWYNILNQRSFSFESNDFVYHSVFSPAVPARTVVLRPAISEAAEESALRAEFAELAMVP